MREDRAEYGDETAQHTEGLSRRSFAFGAVTGSIVGGALAGLYVDLNRTIEDGAEEIAEGAIPPLDTRSGISSQLLDVDPNSYDMTAGMCEISLLVEVADSERVVIQNEVAGDSDRTVENTGERFLSTIVPSDSEVLIYAVDLEAGTSAVLERYHISEDCSLTEVEDGT